MTFCTSLKKNCLVAFRFASAHHPAQLSVIHFVCFFLSPQLTDSHSPHPVLVWKKKKKGWKKWLPFFFFFFAAPDPSLKRSVAHISKRLYIDVVGSNGFISSWRSTRQFYFPSRLSKIRRPITCIHIRIRDYWYIQKLRWAYTRMLLMYSNRVK